MHIACSLCKEVGFMGLIHPQGFAVCISICIFYKEITFAALRSILKSQTVGAVMRKALGYSVLFEIIFKAVSYFAPIIVELGTDVAVIGVGIIIFPIVFMFLSSFKFWGTTHWE